MQVLSTLIRYSIKSIDIHLHASWTPSARVPATLLYSRHFYRFLIPAGRQKSLIILMKFSSLQYPTRSPRCPSSSHDVSLLSLNHHSPSRISVPQVRHHKYPTLLRSSLTHSQPVPDLIFLLNDRQRQGGTDAEEDEEGPFPAGC